MRKPPRIFIALAWCVIGVLFAGADAFPQSHALDAQIEGFVYDQNGAAIPRATVFATNTASGFVRSLLTNETGFYRMPLMPLGTYRLAVEAPNHTRTFREGVTLAAGQTATIDFTLQPGEVTETVTVTGDSPIADAGKTDIGVVMSNRETSNLPLISRNPLNFVLQQANVNGRPNRGFLQFPTISANGFRSRVNYQLDGNTATHAGRAGVRLMVIPETFVNEIQLVSNAFAPEFGNTPGVVMNMVTPSGTNDVDGSVTYFFRRPSFYSRPFSYSSSEKLPDSRVRDIAIKLGLPLIKDRWQVFTGYEQYVKDDKGIPNRLLTITEANRDALIDAGLSPSIFPPAIPTIERGRFMLFRSDLQLNEDHRLAVRFNHADIFIENNISGGLNTLERSVDVSNVDHGTAAQLVSYSTIFVNELRFQWARRDSAAKSNAFSGSGPSIAISNVANFGSPEDADAPPWLENAVQLQNNVTFTTGAHVFKFGGGFTNIRNTNFANVFARYTFPSIRAYVDARNGTNPLSYTRYNESSGDAESRVRAFFVNLFAQDDWKLSARLKLTFGVRYDLYKVPKADQAAALPTSLKFNVDTNNIAPRVAAVYALRQGERPTIIRAGVGIYYEQPWLDMYERTLRQNGNPTYFNFTVTPGAKHAPHFPATFPQGLQLAPQDIDTIAPDLENLYAVHANFQLEQAVSDDASFAMGYVHSGGRHIPVYRSINYIPVRFLDDGRPVYSGDVNFSTRIDPKFNNIQIVESAGVSRYDAFTVQFNARASKGVNVSAHYTLSKATDDAPEQNVSFPNNTSLFLSNPFDRGYDRGRSFADQRHTFIANVVVQPVFDIENRLLKHVANGNQIALIVAANSGYAFNIVSKEDLNEDGLRHDRPLGVARNSGTTPPLFNLDLRYSRFIPIGGRFRFELLAEFTNFFNINSIVQFNNVEVATDTNGNLTNGIPDFRSRNQSTSQESRQTQIGVRFSF